MNAENENICEEYGRRLLLPSLRYSSFYTIKFYTEHPFKLPPLLSKCLVKSTGLTELPRARAYEFRALTN